MNHFFLQCYDKLERFDPRGGKFMKETADSATMRMFIEECSRKTLELSLRGETLTNLQRGRLLDILLWAGELFLLLRTPQGMFAEAACK